MQTVNRACQEWGRCDVWSQPGEEYVYFIGTESRLTYISSDQLMMGAEKLYILIWTVTQKYRHLPNVAFKLVQR